MKKYLTRRKLKLLFIMDEMMIRTSDLRGQSNFYYNGNRVVVPENMRKIPRKNLPQQVMVAMGFCWHGKSRLYVVPEKNQSDFGSLHQIDSEADDHLRYSSAIRR